MEDIIIRGLLADSTVKIMAISGKALVEQARETHGLSRVCTAALGRTLMMTSMMGAQLKNADERVTAMLKGGGEAGNIVCTADWTGRVKGYVENPGLELPPAPNGKLDVALAVGWFGDLTVIRDMGLKEPYVGTCPIQSGEIADDIAYYLTSSDQIPSAVSLGVLFNDDSSVREAGGFIVQLMDGATDETAALLEERIASLPSVTTMLSEGETPESILERILGDMDLQILEDGPVAFRCDCTRERTLKLLSLVSADELQDMVDEGEDVEMVCAFCNSKYQYSPDEIAALIEE